MSACVKCDRCGEPAAEQTPQNNGLLGTVAGAIAAPYNMVGYNGLPLKPPDWGAMFDPEDNKWLDLCYDCLKAIKEDFTKD